MKLYEVLLDEGRVIEGVPVKDGFIKVGSQRVRVFGEAAEGKDRILYGLLLPSLDEGFVLYAQERSDTMDFEAVVLVRDYSSANECGRARLRVKSATGLRSLTSLFQLGMDGGVDVYDVGKVTNIWYDCQHLHLTQTEQKPGWRNSVEGLISVD